MSEIYKLAGVDIEKNDEIIQMLQTKYHERGINIQVGGFSGSTQVKELGYPIAHMTTDGIGTKSDLLAEFGHYYTAGVDVVAMCLNDLMVDRIEPIGFTDMISMGKVDIHIISEIIDGILDSLEGTKCDLLAGETAEMPGVYQDGRFSISGSAMGYPGSNLPPSYSVPGDFLVGIPSTSVHANGFSLIKDRLSLNQIDELHAEFDILGGTKIYYDELTTLMSVPSVHGIAHITGGGIEGNTLRITNPCERVVWIGHRDLETIDLWSTLKDMLHMSWLEMQKVFNCGYGVVFSCESEIVLDIPELHNASIIGYIEEV